MNRRYAVHTHIGVFWDGGVRLLGVYRWFIIARIRCWWHARVENPMRIATVRPVRANAVLEDYYGSEKEWEAAIKEAM
jgi:hypothetical protein